MKHGTEYELLAQQVYQILLNRDWPGKSICVQHDIKLKGTSGQVHQIDVYWEYELAGVTNKVAIECKDYSKPLAIGKVRDFYGVLADLKDVKGIMIASNGFQKGAKEYAQAYGINLKELSVEGENPIVAEIENYIHVSLRRKLFMIDEAWAKDNGINIDSYRKRLSWMFTDGAEWLKTSHLPIHTSDSIIRDVNGGKISSLEDLEAKISPEIIGGTNHCFPFDDAFVSTSSGPIKIKEVLIVDKEEYKHSSINVVAEGFVKAILKDALDGSIQNVLCPDIYEE